MEDQTRGPGAASCDVAHTARAATVSPMDLELLSERLERAGEPRFRTGQVWAWTARGAEGYDAMTDLPVALRARLADEVPFSSLTLEDEAHARDGTVKALFRTHDGRPVEAVLMRYRDERRSLCLSSQSGCPLTCSFCATGQMKFGRNLTASEILDQALHFRRLDDVDHAVFMGMGEPMMNLDNVLEACRRLPDLGIANRRTAISTVGWIPGIDALTAQPMPIRLALSVHAADDALRSEIMPVNDRYPLADVLAACRRFYEASNGWSSSSTSCSAGSTTATSRPSRSPACSTPDVQGQPHPLQPDRHVQRLQPRGDRRVQGRARGARGRRDGAPNARARHRRRLRSAGGQGMKFWHSRRPRVSSSSTRAGSTGACRIHWASAWAACACTCPTCAATARTPLPPRDYAHAKDLVRMLDDLRIERARVVGASFGGWVALQLARWRPRA